MTMAAKWIETITGSFDDKKRWRAYKARQRQLPAPHRTAMQTHDFFFAADIPILWAWADRYAMSYPRGILI